MDYPIIRRTFFLILRNFFGKIEGLENLPKNCPYIIAANHVGNIDYFFIASAIIPYTKKKIHFIAKREKWRDILGDFIVKKWLGCIVTDPDHKEKVIDEALDYLRRGKICAIFPEGKASGNNIELLQGKTGVAKLALKSKLPVVPVGFFGPTSKESFVKSIKHLISSSGKVYIRIGQPITFNFSNNEEISQRLEGDITREIMKKIASLCDKVYPY